jgi:hypothetical protein
MGDLCEFIGKADPRFAAQAIPAKFITDLDDLFVAQADYVVDLLDPIKEKIIGACGGNHEEEVKKHNSFDPLKYIITRLNDKGAKVLNLDYGTSLVRLRIARKVGDKQKTTVLMVSVAHGWGGGELKGAPALRLQRLVGKFSADIYLRAHTHELFGFPMILIGTPRRGSNKLIASPKMLHYCGSYFQAYAQGTTSYAERRELYPTAMGSPSIVLSEDGDDNLIIEVFISDNWWHQGGKVIERKRVMYYGGGVKYEVDNVVAFGVSDTSIYVLALPSEEPQIRDNDEEWEPLDYWIFTRNPGPDGMQAIYLPFCIPTRGPVKRK